jgi:hypothetical protein
MRTPLLSLFLSSLLLCSACSDDTTQKDSGTQDIGTPASCGTSAYLPADSAVGDFKKGTIKAADTGKRLDDLIDGGSEKYKTNNFKCMVQVIYESGSKSYEIKVWLFDQTDATGASGAYTASGSGSFTDITPTVGDASREDLTLPLDYLADMRKGQYLARVQIDDNSAKDDGRAMIKAIASKLP